MRESVNMQLSFKKAWGHSVRDTPQEKECLKKYDIILKLHTNSHLIVDTVCHYNIT